MPEDITYVPGRGKAIKEKEDQEELEKIEFTLKKVELNQMTDWTLDTQKAMDIMNDDNKDNEEAEEETTNEFELDNLSNTEKLKQFESDENDLMTLNKTSPGKCNQKQGVYCSGFYNMMNFQRAVMIEGYTNKQYWIMWTLTSPELENTHGIDPTNIKELEKTRFSIPFKVRRTILKYCPNCSGSLAFD